MDNQKNTGYTGRFGERSAGSTAAGVYRPRKNTPEGARRPSGFSSAGQAARPRAAARPEQESETKKDQKKHKPKKEPRMRRERSSGKEKTRRSLKVLPVIAAVLVLACVLALILGGSGGTVHQMPVIERESVASFTPDHTPLPGTEVP